jgi:hypothetical protein
MFILYAIPFGILLGLALGGRVDGIRRLEIRFGGLAVLGYVLQSLLFVPPVHRLAGDAAPLLYVATNALVVGVLAANARTAGMPIACLGAALNLLVIAINGGFMPADPGVYASRGMTIDGLLNTRFIDHPQLAGLSDWIALPAWLPGTNVISVGDVLVGVGVGAVLALAMRSGRAPRGTAEPTHHAGADGDEDGAAGGPRGPAGPVHRRTDPGPDPYDRAIDTLRQSP